MRQHNTGSECRRLMEGSLDNATAVGRYQLLGHSMDMAAERIYSTIVVHLSQDSVATWNMSSSF
jgi:muramidase (phage lysozyme)